MWSFFFADIVLSLQLKLNPSFRLDKIQFFCRCRPIVTIRTKKPIASARSKTHRFDWNICRFSQIKKIKRLGWNTTRRFVRIKNPTLQLDIAKTSLRLGGILAAHTLSAVTGLYFGGNTGDTRLYTCHFHQQELEFLRWLYAEPPEGSHESRTKILCKD